MEKQDTPVVTQKNPSSPKETIEDRVTKLEHNLGSLLGKLLGLDINQRLELIEQCLEDVAHFTPIRRDELYKKLKALAALKAKRATPPEESKP